MSIIDLIQLPVLDLLGLLIGWFTLLIVAIFIVTMFYGAFLGFLKVLKND